MVRGSGAAGGEAGQEKEKTHPACSSVAVHGWWYLNRALISRHLHVRPKSSGSIAAHVDLDRLFGKQIIIQLDSGLPCILLTWMSVAAFMCMSMSGSVCRPVLRSSRSSHDHQHPDELMAENTSQCQDQEN